MWKTNGHKFAIDSLSSSMRRGRLSHAYLLNGPEGIGKKTLALDIACFVNCTDTAENRPCGSCSQCERILVGNHTDIFIYDPESSEGNSDLVTIDQLRNDFLKQIHRKPFEGRCRVFIIAALEKMRSEQANILLKTLEEPPGDVIIILLTEQIDDLLDTVISRCQVFTLRPLTTSEVTKYVDSYGSDLETNFSTADIKEICRLARGRIGWASRVIDDPQILNNRRVLLDKYESAIFGDLSDRFDLSKDVVNGFGKNRKKAVECLDLWLTWWRDALLVKSGLKDDILNVSRIDRFERVASLIEFQDLISIIKSLRMTFIYLEKNMNTGLLFDNLMLRIPFMR